MAARNDIPEFRVSRRFEAPRDLVFSAWSDPAHLAEWWGPAGFDLRIAKLEFSPGGIFHYAMVTPDGKEMWGRFTYREIEAPARIVFLNGFANAEGALARNPWMPVWPLEIRNEVTFSEEGGATLLELRGTPFNASEDEMRAFEGHFDSMRKGFGGTFDQLAAHLASLSTNAS